MKPKTRSSNAQLTDQYVEMSALRLGSVGLRLFAVNSIMIHSIAGDILQTSYSYILYIIFSVLSQMSIATSLMALDDLRDHAFKPIRVETTPMYVQHKVFRVLIFVYWIIVLAISYPAAQAVITLIHSTSPGLKVMLDGVYLLTLIFLQFYFLIEMSQTNHRNLNSYIEVVGR